MSKKSIIQIGDWVSIYEDIIDRKVQQALIDNKNKIAYRWESYRTLAFNVIGFDDQNLAILVDAQGNEIHISKKALYIVDVH